MKADAVTSILTIGLMISVIILFILIFAFVVVYFKNKKEEKELEKKADINPEENKKIQNTLVTKSYTTQNIKDFMEFEDIKDNMIIQEKGKRYVMVIQCKGINYDLMSSMEKVSVEQGFIEFLNSLNRPIQLYIQAKKVNLEGSLINYNERLKEIENKYRKVKFQFEQAKAAYGVANKAVKDLRFEYIRQGNLLEYTRDIIENTNKMSLNKNILTKNYYIVISYMPENSEELYGKEEIIDMAFSELYTNAQSLIRAISVTGVSGKVLDSAELAELLYTAYNRDASEILGIDKAIKAGYDSLYVTAPDVLDKKIKELDKLVEEKATQLANEAINKSIFENKSVKQEILEEKEEKIEEATFKRAKEIIKENKDYITKPVAEQALKELKKAEGIEETQEVPQVRYTMRRKIVK